MKPARNPRNPKSLLVRSSSGRFVSHQAAAQVKPSKPVRPDKPTDKPPPGQLNQKPGLSASGSPVSRIAPAAGSAVRTFTPVPAVKPDKREIELPSSYGVKVSTPVMEVTETVEDQSGVPISGRLPPLDRKNKVVYLVGLAALCGLLFGAIVAYVLSTRMPQLEDALTTPAPTSAVPTPTPTGAVDKAVVTFEVLNGSGVAGAAGRAADKLKGLGYTADSVGNAAGRVETTEFAIRSDIVGHDTIVTDVLGLFPGTSVVDLADSDFTARLTLGEDTD
ncbi:hypothetical protein A2Z33_00285 [Candidatus Gottesmanbacteria bacterium RBG_16_52_11]|uniref:LytR/CpsA/Psr regulator C-terminal domain-containing protein n=1 Tax=Candidatus Gottesmanbacteria bacterium RBG_16_52_11 TaxID=1798374 RepID=A0A1F5YNZ2_9BACT|nr:MAG: hypothetical protein A2Z33_00285 [Candidatus Gottesmanbacteria bacterium RBG_16_52_11]